MIRARFSVHADPLHLPDNLDPHGLIAFAGSHGASTVLAGGIRNTRLEGRYAAGLKMMLEAVEQSNAAHNAKLKSALTDIGTLLRSDGISCVVLKGGAFIGEDDQAAPWRATSDLDLLVPPSQLHQAARLMQQTGYEMAWDESLYRQEDHQHFPALVSRQTGVAVELHTRALWDPGRDPLEPDEVFASASGLTTMAGIQIPSPEHRVIHLIAHCQISDKFFPAHKVFLKDVTDLAVLCWHHDIDWQQVETAYRRIGRLPELTGFLSTCQTMLGDALPPIALDVQSGRIWATRAVANYYSGKSDQARMAIDILKDYTKRVMMRRGGFALLLTTLCSPLRLRNLFNTHYKKWRS